MIQAFISTILPVIDKRKFLSDIEDARKIVDDTVAVLAMASSTYANYRFASKPVAQFEKVFQAQVKTKLRGNHIQLVHQLLTKTKACLAVVERLAKESNSDIVRAELSFAKLQLVQYVSATTFACRYIRKHVLWVTHAETNLIRQSTLVGKELTKGESEWLRSNEGKFIQVMNAFDHSPSELESILKAIPDVTANADNADAVAASTGRSLLDPLNLVRVGFTFNPIYHLRLAWEDYKFTQYEEMKEDRRLLEYRLEDLRNAKNGEQNPTLDKAIEHYQDLVSDLTFKINKMERDAA